MKFCCGIVLYNPDIQMLNNIKKFEDQVEKIYIYDNSENGLKNKLILEEYLKNEYCYISLGENLGLAYALNHICKIAIEDGFDFIFTMDQDSVFDEGAVKKMIEFAENNCQYGMIIPKIIPYFNKIIRENESGDLSETIVKFAITSGSLLNLDAYRMSEKFDDSLFIEHVDVDFCIKLNKIQRKIIRLNYVILFQRAGNSIPKKLLGRTVHPLFANPIRGYYLFRNQKYLKRKYGKELYSYTGKLYKTLIKTILYEDQKGKRIKLYIEGYISGQRNVMGKYNPVNKIQG